MNELQKLREEFIGKKFIGFYWQDTLDEVYYAENMDFKIGKIIEITAIHELDSGNYYSVSGNNPEWSSNGYCYPLEEVRKNLIPEKKKDLFVKN
jgi:hypothetical protein